MEKVTIIIPVYNTEKYIGKCIESVIEQTYKNLEILIIIDGATDNSQAIIEQYAKKDDRIKIIKQQNKGIFYTRMKGIKKAAANYIYFLDADDWIEKNAIEIMYQYKQKYHSNIVRCQNYYKDEEDKISFNDKIEYIELGELEEKIYPNLFGSYQLSSIWNQLVEKKYFQELKDIDININYGEDYILNLSMYKNIKSILLIPDYLYHYRTTNDSITNQKNYEKLLTKLNNAYKSQIEAIHLIEEYQNITNKGKYQKLAINKTIRDLKNRIIEFASFGIREGKREEVYQEIKKLLKQEEFEQMRQKIELGELLKLSKRENHKYVIKNIYQGNVEKILKYIKRIYLPGKKIKKLIRR